MISIDENNKSKCCGCTACANICPKGAIIMQEDFEGFLYPEVDKSKCINCGLCDKVCPILNKDSEKKINMGAYALRCRDDDILSASTSGGFFTPLAEYVIDNNGIVFGVGYDNDLKIIHKEAITKEMVKEFRGSKYVQSYLGDIFKKVKKYLEDDRLVLFSGTPCQVEGLKRFLNKEYMNLLTVDLICHGTPSPKLWKLYVEFQEKKYKSKIKEVYFRNKTYGYHSGTMKLVFENGKEYYGSARVDYMLKSFFSEISSRPSCYECKFKSKTHNSDITIYDCWNIQRLNPDIKDDDKGYTNIMVNTMNGKNVLNTISDKFDIYKVDIDEQIKNDGIMVENSAIPNKNRKEYYTNLNKVGLERNINQYIKVSLKDVIIEKSKKVLYKTHILSIIKKIKR